MIKSNKIYSPQAYIEKITGNTYIINYDYSVVDAIKTILSKNGYGYLKCYPFKKVAAMLEEISSAVLVDVSNGSEEYYWFEVTSRFTDNEKNVFWCVVQKVYDNGECSTNIYPVECTENPEPDFCPSARYDKYIDYFDTYEEACAFAKGD